MDLIFPLLSAFDLHLEEGTQKHALWDLESEWSGPLQRHLLHMKLGKIYLTSPTVGI